MKIFLFLIFLITPSFVYSQSYFLCDADPHKEKYLESLLLDYKTYEKDNIIVAYLFSHTDDYFLRTIEESRGLFEKFKESILNNTFDFESSEVKKFIDIDLRVYQIKLIKKTQVEWFGVSYLKENFTGGNSWNNIEEFKLNLLNGLGVLNYANNAFYIKCDLIKNNLLGENLNNFHRDYFLNFGNGISN